MLSLQDEKILAKEVDVNYLKKNLRSLSFSSCTNRRNPPCCSLLVKIYCTQNRGFERVAL